MKNIEINDKQKNNLLEMCEKLFPELNLEMYYDDDIADNWKEAIENTSCGNDAQVGYLISNWHKSNAKIIHWFEFCMTHLCDKIWEKYPKYPKNHIYNGLAMTCNRGVKVKTDLILRALKFHPVDYLYEEFKKLK